MSKEEFADFLKSKGIDSEIDDGVVMVLYGEDIKSYTAAYKIFNYAKNLADYVGYKNSIGIRKKRKMNSKEKTSLSDQDKSDNFEQMSMF